MPRRHKIRNPSAAQKQASSSSSQSSKPKPKSQVEVKAAQTKLMNETMEKNPSLKTLLHNFEAMRNQDSFKDTSFEIGTAQILTMPGKSLRAQDKMYDCLTKSINSTLLTTRPLYLHEGVRVQKVTVTRGYDDDEDMDTVALQVNRPVTMNQINAAVAGPFFQQLIDRMHEPMPLDDGMLAIVMKSKFTTNGPALPLRWTSDGCEMTVIIRSLVCLKDEQERWEEFLREINQCLEIALNPPVQPTSSQSMSDSIKYAINQTIKQAINESVIPATPILDSAGQQAIQVIVSNHERKLKITLKFAHPCVPPDQKWTETMSPEVVCLLVWARTAQLIKDPTNMENRRLIDEIQEYMKDHRY